ncbi:MAG: FMN-binding glutamate synthase family protein, partial [Candidatus Omnitrophica bacterium]|nr:FMN-binding glutamate synthase family protein [Candidatus Omnitrophota bacterium]
MARLVFLLISFLIVFGNYYFGFDHPKIWWSMVLFGPVIVIGLVDMVQKRQAIRRNFPVIGNFRYMLEFFRPEINQYFVESNTSGTPFNRLDRSLIYQRAKGELDTLPFGTQKNVYDVGYEWVTHSIMPVHVDPQTLRVVIGSTRAKPYSASIFNIGAMSFGSLSKNAVMALNQGAKMGGFAQNTGEGGLTNYHRQGGDVIWQIGTGYFGCRDAK